LSSGVRPGPAVELSETLHLLTLQKLLIKPFGPFTWHIAIGNVPERARISARTLRRSGSSPAVSTTGIRPHQGQAAMARFFPELLPGCDASEYSVSAIFSVFAIRRSAFHELIHGKSHKHGRDVVHNQKDGRRNRCAARRRAAQVATKRILSTTPVRGVMHQLVSNYS